MSKTGAEILPKLPKREPDSHKGSYGKVAVIGGSLGMAGAVYLAGKGALFSGAGLVELVVPERIIDIISIKITSCIAVGLMSGADGSFSTEAAAQVLSVEEKADVIALGPGIRTTEGACEVVRTAIETELPLVIDADGLNCLSIFGPEILKKRKTPSLLTPHPGEIARLLSREISDVQKDRVSAVKACCDKTGAVTVLKGHDTVVSDGERTYINPTGNPGMAVGGSGDVLTGIITGLLASCGFDPFDAACAGCWLHGAAGDIAAGEKGEISMTAEDILDNIPDAFKKYKRRE